MNLTAKRFLANIVAAALLASGCSGMQAAELPEEAALPSSADSFWISIDAVRSGDWFHLLSAGDEALKIRLLMIESARSSIDMESFLWKPDRTGREILARVLAAADRGVRVRFLLDDSFTMHEGLALHALAEHPNIEIRLYNPFQHRSDQVVLRELFNLGEFSRINHRMHNKVLLIDGRAALAGGRNLADEYFGWHDEQNFRDMEVLTMGKTVPQASHHFDAFWNSGWAFPMDHAILAPKGQFNLADLRSQLSEHTESAIEHDPAAVLERWHTLAQEAHSGSAEFVSDLPAHRDPSHPDERPNQLALELERLIDDAESEVVVVTAYLVPTPELEAAVERLRDRGVALKILTNSLRSNNHLAAHAAYRGHLDRLIEYGADVYEVRASAADRGLYMQLPVDNKELGLHAKLMLIDDDLAFVGSCNFDSRSLNLNTEAGLIIESEAVNRALREHLSVDFAPRNAWSVQRSEGGSLRWVGDDQVLNHQPADSAFQRLEDWFVGILPIDAQM
jgi:putative cardiolipin synthase